MNTQQSGNLSLLNTSPIKQRIFELKQRAEILHDYWKPNVGETIAGEVLVVNDAPLVIKTEDDKVIKIFLEDSPSSCSVIEGKDGYLVKEGDLIAVTYNGKSTPYRVKEYSVLIEAR